MAYTQQLRDQGSAHLLLSAMPAPGSRKTNSMSKSSCGTSRSARHQSLFSSPASSTTALQAAPNHSLIEGVHVPSCLTTFPNDISVSQSLFHIVPDTILGDKRLHASIISLYAGMASCKASASISQGSASKRIARASSRPHTLLTLRLRWMHPSGQETAGKPGDQGQRRLVRGAPPNSDTQNKQMPALGRQQVRGDAARLIGCSSISSHSLNPAFSVREALLRRGPHSLL